MFKEGTQVEDLFAGLDTGIQEESVLNISSDKLANSRFDLIYGESLVTNREFEKAQNAGDIEKAAELTVHMLSLEMALDEESEKMCRAEGEMLGERTSMLLDYAESLSTEFLEAIVAGKVVKDKPELKSAFNRIAQMGALNAKIDAANTKSIVQFDSPYIAAAEVFAKAADKSGALDHFKPFISKEYREPDVASLLEDMSATSLAKLCKPALRLVKTKP